MGAPRLTDDEIIAIYRATGHCKVIGHRFGISPGLVSMIRRGSRWADVIERHIEAVAINAALISAACGVMQ